MRPPLATQGLSPCFSVSPWPERGRKGSAQFPGWKPEQAAKRPSPTNPLPSRLPWMPVSLLLQPSAMRAQGTGWAAAGGRITGRTPPELITQGPAETRKHQAWIQISKVHLVLWLLMSQTFTLVICLTISFGVSLTCNVITSGYATKRRGWL